MANISRTPEAADARTPRHRMPRRARRAGTLAVLAGGLMTGVIGRPVAAHEGDYYPDETLPEKARSIIDDSTNGGSTTLIVAGAVGLVAVGAALYLLNSVRSRSSTTRTAPLADSKTDHRRDDAG